LDIAIPFPAGDFGAISNFFVFNLYGQTNRQAVFDAEARRFSLASVDRVLSGRRSNPILPQ
jgi:hypothetical protein